VYVRGAATAEAIEWGFWLALTVWWVVELALSPFQLVLMGVVLNIVVILSETPTGVVADLYSRRRSLILGEFIMAAGFFWAFASRNYWVILPAQALFAFGWTFRSGADIAWVTDELRGQHPDSPEVANDDAIERLILRKHAAGILGSLVIVVLVMLIGSWSLRTAAFLCAGAKSGVGVYYLRRMTENHFTPQSESSTFRQTLTEGTRVIRRTPRLTVAVAAMMIAGLSSEIFDRLGFAHFIDVAGTDIAGIDLSGMNDDSLISTGLLFLVMGVAGVAVNRTAQRSLDRQRGVVLVTAVLLVIAGVGGLLAATTGLVVLLSLGLTMQDSTRESLHSVFGSWINRDAPTEVRATVHSLTGQGLAISEIGGGIVLGLLAERAGLSVVLVVSAVLMLIAGGVALLARGMEPVIHADRIGP